MVVDCVWRRLDEEMKIRIWQWNQFSSYSLSLSFIAMLLRLFNVSHATYVLWRAPMWLCDNISCMISHSGFILCCMRWVAWNCVEKREWAFFLFSVFMVLNISAWSHVLEAALVGVWNVEYCVMRNLWLLFSGIWFLGLRVLWYRFSSFLFFFAVEHSPSLHIVYYLVKERENLVNFQFKPQQPTALRPSQHFSANSIRLPSRPHRQRQSLLDADSPPNESRCGHSPSSCAIGNPCTTRRRTMTNRASRRRRTRRALRFVDERMFRQCQGWLWRPRRRHQRGDTEWKVSWNAENEREEEETTNRCQPKWIYGKLFETNEGEILCIYSVCEFWIVEIYSMRKWNLNS